MKKILFVSNTANFSKFNHPFMNWCRDNGWCVDYCAPDDEIVTNCNCHHILPIPRSPFSLKVFTCIKQLRKLLEIENYDIIHCHTPMGSVVTRLAARKLYKKGKVKIIYTAHGFHFYKGAPCLNWLIYYPIEKFLSKYCDYLITINEEDYVLAQSKFKKTKVVKFDGVGVDFKKYYPVTNDIERKSLRSNFGYSDEDFIILYVAEFIQRKNHEQFFSIITKLVSQIPNLKIILAGKGRLLDYFKQKTSNLDLQSRINFLGYTKDVASYCRLSDILMTTSLQEGLPISMIEAIGTGIPVVASKIRGHVDVIENSINGFLCNLKDENEFCDAVINIYTNRDLRKKLSENAINLSKKYSIEIAVEKMAEIYKELIND